MSEMRSKAGCAMPDRELLMYEPDSDAAHVRTWEIAPANRRALLSSHKNRRSSHSIESWLNKIQLLSELGEDGMVSWWQRRLGKGRASEIALKMLFRPGVRSVGPPYINFEPNSHLYPLPGFNIRRNLA